MVQLREKDLNTHELSILAKWILPTIREYDGKLLINASSMSKTLEESRDLVEMAMDIHADGVQLGQGSVSPTLARELMGPEKLIGYSAHTAEEAKKAESDGADFVTLSPIYKIKKAGMRPIGTEPITQAAKSLKIPVYALGGIDEEKVGPAIEAGAYGIAVISELLSAKNITKKAEALLEQINSSMKNQGNTLH
jgi:thiamine-phosphate pyrophosphorylase